MPNTPRLLWSSVSRWVLVGVWLVVDAVGAARIEVRVESWGGLVRGTLALGATQRDQDAAIALAGQLRRCRGAGAAIALLATADRPVRA